MSEDREETKYYDVEKIKDIYWYYRRLAEEQWKKFIRIIKKQGWEKRLVNRKIDKRLRILYLLFTQEENKLDKIRLHPTELSRRLKLSRNTIYKALVDLTIEGCIEHMRWISHQERKKRELRERAEIRIGTFGIPPRLKPRGKHVIHYALWLIKKTNKVPDFSKVCEFWFRLPKALEWYDWYQNMILAYAVRYLGSFLPPPFTDVSSVSVDDLIPWFLAFKIDVDRLPPIYLPPSTTKEELKLFLEYLEEYPSLQFEYWVEEFKQLFPERKIETNEDAVRLIDEYGSIYHDEIRKREKELYIKFLKKH